MTVTGNTDKNNLASMGTGKTVVCKIGALGGRVSCAGNNERGQLGDGSLISKNTFATTVIQVTMARSVACTAHSCCAVLDSGRVLCWVSNQHGDLGNSAPSLLKCKRGLAFKTHTDSHLPNTTAVTAVNNGIAYGGWAIRVGMEKNVF